MLAPKLSRGRIYYGWYIVAVGFAIQMLSAGVQAFAIGVFTVPMTQELGWGRGAFAGVVSLGFIVSGVAAPFIGGIMDRYGPRRLVLAGAAIVGLALVGHSQIQELWQFYLLRGVMLPLGGLLAGFVVVNVAVANWFQRKRGRALGFAGMGTSLGGFIFTPLSQALISLYGWRTAWIILGILVWVTLSLLAALFLKRRPEDLGLSLEMEVTGEPSPPPPQEKRWTRREAIRTPALWLLALGFGMIAMALSGIVIHLFPYLRDMGFSPSMATYLLMTSTIGAFVSRPLWGWLSEGGRAKGGAIISAVLVAGSILIILAVGKSGLVFLAIFIYGLSVGGALPIQEVLWADYYGRLSLGRVRSLSMPLSMSFSAAGPYLAGLFYDLQGNYRGVFTLFALLVLGGTFFIALATSPAKKAVSLREAPERRGWP